MAPRGARRGPPRPPLARGALAEAGAGGADGLVDEPEVLDRAAEVAGVEALVPLDRVGDLTGRAVGGAELVGPSLLAVQLDPCLAEHPLDEVARLREGARRVLFERLLQLRPARLPLVQLEAGLVLAHAHATVMRAEAGCQTRPGPAVDSPAVRVLLVGAGGREHALAWKLAQADAVEELHAAPGNPGIARLGTCHPVRPEDGESLLALALELGIDLVVIGPEGPLVEGVADRLRHAGVAVFGPGEAAARIEGSKTFAKEVMEAAGVPTSETLAVARVPCVVKADGLAAGKGVFVCRTQAELDEGLRAAAGFDGPLVIEELLEGEEVSVFGLCDGRSVIPLAAAQDFKRIGDGDTGPNTGGMGSYSPVAGMGPDAVEEILDLVHRPVVAELASRGAPFVGVLFAGLMLTAAGPKVLEFNCRFGDPETQSLLPRLEGDFAGALRAAAGGDVSASS